MSTPFPCLVASSAVWDPCFLYPILPEYIWRAILFHKIPLIFDASICSRTLSAAPQQCFRGFLAQVTRDMTKELVWGNKRWNSSFIVSLRKLIACQASEVWARKYPRSRHFNRKSLNALFPSQWPRYPPYR